MATSNNRSPNRRFAFWSYDLYPFVLGSEGMFTPEGHFSADRYSRTFSRESIIAVYPVKEGTAILERLQALREEYRKRSDELMDDMVRKAHATLPELKPWRKERGRKP